MAVYKSSAATAARARMAKRAKSQRFWKENKKRVTYGVVLFVLLVVLAFFTPLGPDYYYGGIQGRKIASPGVVSEGVLRDLYKLGVFYRYTLREPDALRMFDEMSMLRNGFTLSEYSVNPDAAFEKRRQAQIRVDRGDASGPPFRIADSDRRFMALAIWRAGEILQKTQSRLLVVRLYEDLYLHEFMEYHPQDLDPEVTAIVQGMVERSKGLR